MSIKDKIDNHIDHLWNNRKYNNYNKYVKIFDEIIPMDFEDRDLIFSSVLYMISKDLDYKLYAKIHYSNDTMIKIIEVLENKQLNKEERQNLINLILLES